MFFGSEKGSADELLSAARICESDEFVEKYKHRVSTGEGAATVFASLLEEQGAVSLGSNDLLGVSYARSVLRNKYGMDIRTTKRLGAAYNDREVSEGELPSASAVRCLVECGRINEAVECLPENAARIILEAYERGETASNATMLDAALMYFRLHEGEDFSGIAECGGGLANRICAAAREAKSGEELVELVKTKAYTNARIKRAMLYCMTGVGEETMRARPEYTTLLAANERGRELLSKNRGDGGITVVTKPADAPKESGQYKLSSRLDAIFTFALESKKSASDMLKKSAYIV